MSRAVPTLGDLKLVVTFHTCGHIPVPGISGTLGENAAAEVAPLLEAVENHRAWSALRVWSEERPGGGPVDVAAVCSLQHRIALWRGVSFDGAEHTPLDDVLTFLRGDGVEVQSLAAEQAPPPADECRVSVDDEDLAILRVLAERPYYVLTVRRIAGQCPVSARTVSGRVNSLIDAKLVKRPKGKKQGAMITFAGLELLKRHSETKS
jgi:hypothetical protein